MTLPCLDVNCTCNGLIYDSADNNAVTRNLLLNKIEQPFENSDLDTSVNLRQYHSDRLELACAIGDFYNKNYDYVYPHFDFNRPLSDSVSFAMVVKLVAKTYLKEKKYHELALFLSPCMCMNDKRDPWIVGAFCIGYSHTSKQKRREIKKRMGYQRFAITEDDINRNSYSLKRLCAIGRVLSYQKKYDLALLTYKKVNIVCKDACLNKETDSNKSTEYIDAKKTKDKDLEKIINLDFKHYAHKAKKHIRKITGKGYDSSEYSNH